MKNKLCWLVLAFFIGVWAQDVSRCRAQDAIDAWRKPTVRPVSATPGRHTIHSYFVCNPESPDGKRVLFFASTDPRGYVGDICMIDRDTGRETVLARDVHTEDAHRAACQQWTNEGRHVAFHEVKNSRWRVVLVEVETQQHTVVAEDRQLAFGVSAGNLLPLYGCHWNPGSHRDLELYDVRTGKLRTAVTMQDVRAKYGEWLRKEFGEKETSIFFPVISPDQRRAFFKIAAGNGGDVFMSKGASQRQGLVVCDLATGQLISLREKWGHPAWFPDSRRIIEVGNLWLDSNDMAVTRVPLVPQVRGSHPSVSPDSRLTVTDGLADNFGGQAGEWCVVVGDLRGGQYQLIQKFDQTRGAKSWRRNDPHPIFSADGRRLYYNTSDGEWTRLMVAEASVK